MRGPGIELVDVVVGVRTWKGVSLEMDREALAALLSPGVERAEAAELRAALVVGVSTAGVREPERSDALPAADESREPVCGDASWGVSRVGRVGSAMARAQVERSPAGLTTQRARESLR